MNPTWVCAMIDWKEETKAEVRILLNFSRIDGNAVSHSEKSELPKKEGTK